jgi:hypothetical protein
MKDHEDKPENLNILETDYDNYILLKNCNLDEKGDVYKEKIDEFYFLLGYLTILIVIVYFFGNDLGYLFLSSNYSLGDYLFYVTNNHLNILKIVLVVYAFNKFNLFSATFLIYIDSLGIITDSLVRIFYDMDLEYLNYTSIIMVSFVVARQHYLPDVRASKKKSNRNFLESFLFSGVIFLLTIALDKYYNQQQYIDSYCKFVFISLNMSFLILYLYFRIFDYTFEGLESTKKFYGFTKRYKVFETIFFMVFTYLGLDYLFNRSELNLIKSEDPFYNTYHKQNLSRIFFLIGALASNFLEYTYTFNFNYFYFASYNLRSHYNLSIYNNTSIGISMLRFFLMILFSGVFIFITNFYFLSKDLLYLDLILNFLHSFMLFYVFKRIFAYLNLLNNSIFEKFDEEVTETNTSHDHQYNLLNAAHDEENPNAKEMIL